MYVAARLVEPAVQRAGEPELLVVADDAEPRVRDVREYLGRAIGRRVVDDDELEIARRLAEALATAAPGVALAVVNGEEHGDERRGWHGRPVAYGPCRGSFRRSTSSSRRSVVPTSSARLLDSLEAQGYPRVRVIVVDQNADERLQRSRARGATSSVEHVRAERRPLARTQRRARARRCRRRRVSRRRLRLSARPPEPGRRASCRGCRPRRRHGQGRGCERALFGLVEAGRGDPHGRQPLEPRESRSRSSSGAHSSSASATSTSASGSARRSRGRRARRSTTSSAQFGPGHASSTTPHSSYGTTFGRTTPESAPATARASATCCASTTTRRGSSRACSSALSAARSSLPCGLDGDRARYRLATFRGRVRGYRGARRAKISA